MKFIPKEFDVYYAKFIPDSDYDPNSNSYWYEKENSMLSFFVSTHDEGTSAYKNRSATALDWNSGWRRKHMSPDQARITNEPTKGYKFVNMTRRYRTSNVLFRIEHPLGYIFEISSENAFDIIENCTIINGVIQEELFLNTSKYLYNTTFDLYKEQVQKEEDAKAKAENAKTITALDMCEFMIQESKWRDFKTYEVQYLGKVHVALMDESYDQDRQSDFKSSLVHVYYCPSNDSVHFCTDAKHKSGFVKSIENKNGLTKVPDDLGEFCNEKINARKVICSAFKNISTTLDIICSSSKPFNRGNIVGTVERVSDEYNKDLRHLLKLGEVYYFETNYGNYNRSWYNSSSERYLAPFNVPKGRFTCTRYDWTLLKEKEIDALKKSVYALMFKVQR